MSRFQVFFRWKASRSLHHDATAIASSRRKAKRNLSTIVAFVSLLFAVAALLFTSACGSGMPKVARLDLTSTQPSISVGEREQFTATARDSAGNVITTAVLTWQSSSPNVAMIGSTSGLAQGLLPGTTTINVSADGITSSPATLTVTPGFILTGNMITPRVLPTATLLNNGMVLIAGGNNSGVDISNLSSAEIYNPATGTFTATGSLNVPRFLFTATLLNNGTVLIAGGIGNLGQPIADAELYNPATGTFTPTGSMNVPRYEHTATLLASGKVLMASGAFTTSAELYDPVTGTFGLTGSVNQFRRKHSAVLLNGGDVLIASGLGDSGYLTSAERYDPSTGAFTLTGDLNVAREFFTATLLNNGMVLIAGGSNNNSVTSAELFDPQTQSFSLTGSMNLDRFDHTATLLNNGMLLVTGGIGSSVSSGTGAELYDPVAGTFSVTGSMNTSHADHTATLLNNGTVLVAGGSGTSQGSVGIAELYEPGSFTPAGLESITVMPSNSTASPNTYQSFFAIGQFASGTQRLASVTWSSANAAAVQITNDVTNRGVALTQPSTVTQVPITATAGSVSGSALLTLRPAGFVATASMHTPREFGCAAVLHRGRALVVGGEVTQAPLPAELYEPRNGIFVVTGTPLVKRSECTATLLENGTVLVAGGFNVTGNTLNPLSIAELYNPSTGTFIATGSLNVGRYNHTATLLSNGMVLIAGGQTSDSTELTSAELYDPSTGVFTLTGTLTTARASHAATPLHSGLVLITGGQTLSGFFVASAELFDPSTGSFSSTGNMSAVRGEHTATLLVDGEVLVSGGIGASGQLSTAELYNPSTGIFLATGSLNTGRFDHTATLLNTGKVLVAGGIGASRTLASTEVYDPTAGTFTIAGNMTTPHLGHTASLFDSGAVLIAGGANGATIVATAELY
jgi:hypothetical protein